VDRKADEYIVSFTAWNHKRKNTRNEKKEKQKTIKEMVNN